MALYFILFGFDVFLYSIEKEHTYFLSSLLNLVIIFHLGSNKINEIWMHKFILITLTTVLTAALNFLLIYLDYINCINDLYKVRLALIFSVNIYWVYNVLSISLKNKHIVKYVDNTLIQSS